MGDTQGMKTAYRSEGQTRNMVDEKDLGRVMRETDRPRRRKNGGENPNETLV